MITMLSRFLCSLLVIHHVESGQFYGGSMSFEAKWQNGKCQVQLMLLTGWVLGDGPCGTSCSEADIGNSTTKQRKLMLQQKNDDSYYGIFYIDYDGSDHRFPVTPRTRGDIVQLVNDRSQWEMESSIMEFELDRNGDIIFEGTKWMPFRNVISHTDLTSENSSDWHMQVKIDNARRVLDKTLGPPNSSPVVLVKPYYEFDMERDYTVRLPIIDFDGDRWECHKSKYQEAGLFLSTYQANSKFDACHTILHKACKVSVKSASCGLKEGDTGVIVVTVRDYLKRTTQFENRIKGTGESLSAVTVQFYYRIKANVSNPFFLSPPTPEVNQVYVVHIGAQFTADVYASTNVSDRTIMSFDFIRRDTKYVERSTIRNANLPQHPKAVVVTAVWRPKPSEIGKHILCANVKDSEGYESVDMQCFIIEIRDAVQTKGLIPNQGPYFVNFPKESDLICSLNSYCRFPIFAASSTIGGVIRINGSSDDLTDLKVYDSDSPLPVQLTNGLNASKVEIQYFANIPGIKTICMEAADRNYPVRQCFNTKVLGKDPCDDSPCQNLGRCVSDEDFLHFMCICKEGFKGKLCNESDTKKTGKHCYNGGTLVVISPKMQFCSCADGFVGDYCTHNASTCIPYPCNSEDICEDVNLKNPCHQSTVQTETCNPACGNKAVCVNKKCICPIGFQIPPSCNVAKATAGMFQAHFVPPTPESGSEVTCDSDTFRNECMFPIFMESSNYSDIRCVTITYTPKASYDTMQHPNLHKNEHDFVVPTPSSESIISCVVNQPCHFMVYTKAVCGMDCLSKPVLKIKSSPIGIFPAVDVGGICQTDIVYTDIQHVHEKHICLKSRVDGASRCFWIKVTDGINDCQKVPSICQHGGICLLHSNGTAFCQCTDKHFTGEHCEVGPCEPSHCNNNGECHTTGTTKTCFCKLGYSGKTCRTPDEVISNKTTAVFRDHTYSTTVFCYVDMQCYIPYVVGARTGKIPAVSPGFHSPDIEFRSASVEETKTSPGNYHSVIKIVGHKIGTRKLCVKTKGSEGESEDETCITVIVKKGVPSIPDPIKPFFIKPTLTDGSRLECQVGKPCHLDLWVSNDEFLTKCPEVQSDKGPSEGVHVFQRPNDLSPCMLDVVFKTEIEQNYTVCFTPYTPEHSTAGGFGERRCYDLDIRENLTALSPCNYKKCAHGGFCDTQSGEAKCLCMVGYSGELCQNKTAVPQTGPSNGFGDTAPIKTLSCYIDTDCPVQFTFNDPSPSLTVDVGGQSNGLLIRAPPSQKFVKLSDGTYQGHMIVLSTVLTTHYMCLQRRQGSSVIEERCFYVNTLPKVKINPVQPHFKIPSLPDNSEVYCVPGKECHVILSLSPGSQTDCPDLQRNEGDQLILHVFHSNQDKQVVGNCTADIAFNPASNKTGKERYCFTAVLPNQGIVGEKRCFDVVFDKPTPTTTCQNNPCHNNGICLLDTPGKAQIPTCLCPMGKINANCENDGFTVQTNHSSYRQNIPGQVFVDTAVPELLSCVVNKPCGLAIVTSGPKPTVAMCSNDSSLVLESPVQSLSSPVGRFLSNLQISGGSEGNKTVCVQLTDSPKANQETCFTVSFVKSKQTVLPSGTLDKNVQDPTTPDGSSFECEEGSTCHILVHTKATSGQQCSRVVQTRYSTASRVVGSISVNSSTCLTDMAVRCKSSGENTVCIEDGSLETGERCLTVQCRKQVKPRKALCPVPSTTEETTTDQPTSADQPTSTTQTTTVTPTTPTTAKPTTAHTTTDNPITTPTTTNPTTATTTASPTPTTTSTTANPTTTPTSATPTTTNPTTTSTTSNPTPTTTPTPANPISTTAPTTTDLTTSATPTTAIPKMATTPISTNPTLTTTPTMASPTSTTTPTTSSLKPTSTSKLTTTVQTTMTSKPITSVEHITTGETTTTVGQTTPAGAPTTSPLQNSPNPSAVDSGCSSLTPEMAIEAAQNGLVQCTCFVDGEVKEIIPLRRKATTAQILRAAGIGAGSMTAAMTLAWFIYFLVSKITSKESERGSASYERSRKRKPRSRRDKM